MKANNQPNQSVNQVVNTKNYKLETTAGGGVGGSYWEQNVSIDPEVIKNLPLTTSQFIVVKDLKSGEEMTIGTRYIVRITEIS